MNANHAQQRVRLMRMLFPELTNRIDAAYEVSAGPNPEAEFDTWLDAQVVEVLPSAAQLIFDDASVVERFERAFSAAALAMTGIGIELPDLDVFASVGIDLARFSEAMQRDPELVPVPAPYGLGAEVWQRAFAAVTNGPELLLGAEALREFVTLDSVPEPGLPLVDAMWTLRLIPGASRPETFGLAFAHGPHISLPEMLMLQLIRFELGERPVDAQTFTWLAGELAGGRIAARHVYDATENAVRITCREVMSQGPHLGARHPIS